MRRYRILQKCDESDNCRCDVSRPNFVSDDGKTFTIIHEFDSYEWIKQTDAGTLTGLAYPGREGAFILNNGEECVLQVQEEEVWKDVKSFRLNAFGPFFDQILEPEMMEL